MSHSKKHSNLKTLLAFLITIITLLITADFLYYGFVVNVNKLKNENPSVTAFMQYRINQWKKKNEKVKIRRLWVPLSYISRDAARAVICAEDAKFWNHDGFDFEAIRNAMEKNIKAKKAVLGASTISQQLAKNLFLTPSKTPLRKLNEAVLTWRMEQVLTKKRILELYLNVAEWGKGIYGIEAASQFYFHKPSLLLDPTESSLLAAVLPNPLRFSPVKPSRYVLRRSMLIRKVLGGNIAAVAQLVKSESNEAENAGSDSVGSDSIKNADILPNILDSDTVLICDTLSSSQHDTLIESDSLELRK
jgi:monofunctional biosynthetic peptidoglycan transglycosylase